MKIINKITPKIMVEKKKTVAKPLTEKKKTFRMSFSKFAKGGLHAFDFSSKLTPTFTTKTPKVYTYTRKLSTTKIIKIVKQQIKATLQGENNKFEKSFAISINLKNGNTENIISIVDNLKIKNSSSYFELNAEEYQEYKNDMPFLYSKQNEVLKFDDIGKDNRGIIEGG